MTAVLLGFGVLLVVLLLLNAWPASKKVRDPFELPYAVGDDQFVRSMGALLGPPLADGCEATELLNGDAIFPAMLAAIRSARETVTFETYIYWKGETGHAFSEALCERARAGVRCHVILDWIGSADIDEADVKAMEDAGVQVVRYHPLRWYHLARLNERTHRKLLVVDGRVGFTGGVGIADEWTGDGFDPKHWRDTHFRVVGPVVAQMQAAFVDGWLRTTGELLDGPGYFPPLESCGAMRAQVFSSSPRQGNDSVRLMYLMSIAAARRSIRMSYGYFVPDRGALAMLERAVRRGVKVEIVLPGRHIDAPMTRFAARGLYGRLLKRGIRIFEYQPAMYHCKVLIVDEAWVSVGSTNFDNRSFLLNEEANLNVLDEAFAGRQVAVFEQDKAHAEEITLEAWRRRPLGEKLLNLLTIPVRSQM
ncbi:MAG TPA: phospholipase D-like domain-containing protein [Rhodothermales bacterium]|nr:phospholipase D-like domain-containing protein [Rhodothermales bacterium]